MKEENNVNKVRAVKRTKLYLESSLSEGNILDLQSRTVDGVIILYPRPHYELVTSKSPDSVGTLRRRGVPPSGLIEVVKYYIKKDSEGVYLEEKAILCAPEGTEKYGYYDKILTEKGIVE